MDYSAKSSPPSATNDNLDEETQPTHGPFAGALLMGISFYSRLPTGELDHSKFDFATMVRPLAFVSLIVGIVPAMVLLILSAIGLSPLFAAVVSVGLSAILTGAMAEDALADAMDGLFGGKTIAQKLEIMYDSRHGTYGVLGIVIPFTLRIFALATMAAISPVAAASVWLASSVLARSIATLIAAQLPPARADGVSAGAGQLPLPAASIGIALALAISFLFCVPFVGFFRWLITLIVIFFVFEGCKALMVKLIKGQTGDTIGATQLTLEIAILSSFMMMTAI